MFSKKVTLLLALSGLGAGFALLTGCQNSGGGGFAANDEALYLFDDGTSNIPQRSNYEEPEPATYAAASSAPSLPSPQPTYSAPASTPAPAPSRQSVASSTNDTQYYSPDPAPSRPAVRTASVSTATSSPSRSTGSTGSYTVRRGDTLYEIARAHGMSVSALKSLNGLSSNTIHPGQSLAISGSGSSSRPSTRVATSSSSGGSYTVRSGDTLWGISRKHGVSVTAIKSANGLSSNTIQPGQRLSIP